MCGIVAYSGSRQAQKILIEGLKRLEYRGYDSSGICIQNGKGLKVVRAKGKLAVLEGSVPEPIDGSVGIGHTRWATHGAPSVENAHPHSSMDGTIAVVHNGIIENYAIIKDKLQKEGVVFKSETDTEVIAHLIAKFYKHERPRQPRQGRARGPDQPGRRLRHRRRLLQGARRPGRRPPRQPPGAGRGRGGVLPGLGRLRHRRAHPEGDLPGRQRHGGAERLLQDHQPGQRRGPPRDPERGVQRRAGGQGQLRALHAQGDLRAAPDRAQLHARPRDVRAGHRQAAAASTWCSRSCAASSASSSPPAAPPSTPARWASTSSRSWPASRWRWNTPPSSATATPSSPTRPWSSPSPSPARPPTPWPPCARPSRRAPPCSASATWWARTIARETDGGVYLHAGPEIGVASTKAFTSQVTVLTLHRPAAGPPAPRLPRHRHAHLQGPAAPSRTRSSRSSSCNDADQDHRRGVQGRAQLPVPGPRLQLSRWPWKARSS